MNASMSRSLRTFAALLLAAGLLVASVLPAVAYNEENVQHVRLVALDSIRCGSPIRLQATLTDRQGNPVVGATVIFTFKKSRPGDLLTPPSDVSDAQGKADTVLRLGPSRGVRQIIATVALPGTAKDQFTISAAPWPGCGGSPGGGGIVLPATTVLPPTGGNLPATSTAEWLAPVVAQNLPIGAALAVAIGMLVLLSVMRRARGSRPSGTR